MELIFNSHSEISLTENHIKQLHRALLKHGTQDERHRGEYTASIADAVTMARANRNTVKLHFKNLVSSGHLRPEGRGRGARYRLS